MISGFNGGSNPEATDSLGATEWIDEVIGAERQPALNPEDLVPVAVAIGRGLEEARKKVLGDQATSSLLGEGPNPRTN